MVLYWARRFIRPVALWAAVGVALAMGACINFNLKTYYVQNGQSPSVAPAGAPAGSGPLAPPTSSTPGNPPMPGSVGAGNTTNPSPTQPASAANPLPPQPSPNPALDAAVAAKVDAAVAKLPKVEVQPDRDIITGNSQPTFSDGQDGNPRQNIVQSHSVTLTFDKLAAFDPNADTLWPGAIVPGDSIKDGVFRPLPLLRAPGRITVTDVNFSNGRAAISADISRPSLPSMQQAMQFLLSQPQTNVTSAKISFDERQFFSLEQGFVEVGLSAKYLSASVKTGLQSDSYSKNSNFVVKFIQRYYTVSFEYPGGPSTFLAGPDKDETAIMAALGTQAQPAYVSSISYGRMLLLFFSSSEDSSKVKATLDAGFSSVATDVSTHFTDDQKKLVQASEIRVLALGGPASGAIDLLTGDKISKLDQYLRAGQNFSVDSPAAPIGYELRYLTTGDVARLSMTTDYQAQTSNVLPIKSLDLHIHTTTDDKDADDDGEKEAVVLTVKNGNKILAQQTVGVHEKWDNGDSRVFHLPLAEPVPYDQRKNMTVTIHKIPNEQSGKGWHMWFNVTTQLDNGQPPREVLTHSPKETEKSNDTRNERENISWFIGDGHPVEVTRPLE